MKRFGSKTFRQGDEFGLWDAKSLERSDEFKHTSEGCNGSTPYS